MTWTELNCKLCTFSVPIGLYFPDEWTTEDEVIVEVTCPDCVRKIKWLGEIGLKDPNEP